MRADLSGAASIYLYRRDDKKCRELLIREAIEGANAIIMLGAFAIAPARRHGVAAALWLVANLREIPRRRRSRARVHLRPDMETLRQEMELSGGMVVIEQYERYVARRYVDMSIMCRAAVYYGDVDEAAAGRLAEQSIASSSDLPLFLAESILRMAAASISATPGNAAVVSR